MCSPVRLQSPPRIPKPNPPVFENIQLTQDLHCDQPQDQLMCKIIFNISNLIKYICQLESAPVWQPGSKKICK